MYFVVMVSAVVSATVLFCIGKKLREGDIPYEWCHSDTYNITYKRSYLEVGDIKLLCYSSNDRSKYLAVLKARTVLFLEGEDHIVLRWKNRDEVITLRDKDKEQILEMLGNMSSLAKQEKFRLPIGCSEEKCIKCGKKFKCNEKIKQ